jgi:hypothetical protein
MRSTILVLALLTFAGTAWGQKVKVEYKQTTDFSNFKTYTWVKGTPAKNPLIDQMIVDGVDRELAARGLTRKEADGDIQVMYMAAVDFDLQVPLPSYSGAGGTAPSTGIATLGPAWEVRKGTLALYIFDRGGQNIIWRGRAEKSLSEAPSGDLKKDASRIEKTVTNAIVKMFKKYPLAKPSQ